MAREVWVRLGRGLQIRLLHPSGDLSRCVSRIARCSVLCRVTYYMKILYGISGLRRVLIDYQRLFSLVCEDGVSRVIHPV